MNWLSGDGWLLLAAKTIRTFGYGLLGVVLGLYLEEAGYDARAVGLILTTALLGSALLTGLMAARADRIGRRRTLILSTLLMIASGLAFGFAQNIGLLIAAALTGTISATSGEVGPFESIEQAILPQTTTIENRNKIFGWYNTASALAVALGALAAGTHALLQRAFGMDSLTAYRVMFTAYSALAGLSLICLLMLSSNVELASPPSPTLRATPPPSPSGRGGWGVRSTIFKLSALFALDAFAGGFVVQSLVAYWFALKFHAGSEILGPVFFAVNVIKAGSYQIAVALADRIGLINTMVFTHLPSNILLMLIPSMPTLPSAVACLLARHMLAQMDVPARGSYVVAVVPPEDRTKATGMTTMARTIAQALGPAIAGSALQLANLGAPFFIGGALKIVYDLALYCNFKAIKPEGEKGSQT